MLKLLEQIALCPECSNQLFVKDKEITDDNIFIIAQCEECDTSWRFEVNISEI